MPRQQLSIDELRAKFEDSDSADEQIDPHREKFAETPLLFGDALSDAHKGKTNVQKAKETKGKPAKDSSVISGDFGHENAEEKDDRDDEDEDEDEDDVEEDLRGEIRVDEEGNEYFVDYGDELDDLEEYIRHEGGYHGGVKASAPAKSNALQPSTHSIRKFENKINLTRISLEDKTTMSSAVSSVYKEAAKKEDQQRIRVTEKSDRATSELVLDPRTRMILYKMLNKNVFDEVNGCVSTGKEANVYHAFAEDRQEYAIKIYKTSILVFKDRDRYVTGEFRFRRGYCKHNPRKMVKVWAEKEMRNLNRLQSAGIPSPKPLVLRLHVLLMTFIGKDGWPAPRLKDASLNEEQLAKGYIDLVKIMRKMYHVCRLVHADLSEYNIL
eukprot:TRINITY_DN4868_c0_g1_i1.p1 TRINITY_DN4868_c0_g1~~TRINITY_DN4868_c0_g1_i1.p1  ORF type:complete len:382 (+),score=94.75 TRINITY_DN4868_c0_g1_i1:56-1201(+)